MALSPKNPTTRAFTDLLRWQKPFSTDSWLEARCALAIFRLDNVDRRVAVAADQRQAAAQNDLGTMYCDGQGVSQNDADVLKNVFARSTAMPTRNSIWRVQLPGPVANRFKLLTCSNCDSIDMSLIVSFS